MYIELLEKERTYLNYLEDSKFELSKANCYSIDDRTFVQNKLDKLIEKQKKKIAGLEYGLNYFDE